MRSKPRYTVEMDVLVNPYKYVPGAPVSLGYEVVVERLDGLEPIEIGRHCTVTITGAQFYANRVILVDKIKNWLGRSK